MSFSIVANVLNLLAPQSAEITVPSEVTAVNVDFDRSMVVSQTRSGSDMIVRLSNGEVIQLVDYYDNLLLPAELFAEATAAALASGKGAGAGLALAGGLAAAGLAGGLGGDDAAAEPPVAQVTLTSATGGSDGMTTFEGAGEPGATVIVTLPGGEKLETMVGVDGTFSVTSTAAVPNGMIELEQTDASGTLLNDGSYEHEDTSVTAPVVTPEASDDGTEVSGTGEPGASIEIFDDAGNSLGTTTVEDNGTWSVTVSPAVMDGDEITVTQTDINGNSADTSATLTRDNDGDGVRDNEDIDDDGDGILDVNEMGAPIALNLSKLDGTLTETTPVTIENGEISGGDTIVIQAQGVAQQLDAIDLGDRTVSLEATFTRDMVENPNQGGYADGNLVLSGYTSDAIDVNNPYPEAASETGDEVVFTLGEPLVVQFSHETSDVADFAPVDGGFGHEILLAAEGGFTIHDPDGQLEIVSNENGVLVIREVGPQDISAQAATWVIQTAEPVDTFRVQGDAGDAEGTSATAGINIAVLDPDTDNDGLIDSLDTDSDNGGMSDNAEAQLGQADVVPSGEDTDGDGLDDAYDENLSGAENSQGLTPADTDGDGTADVVQGAPGSDAYPAPVLTLISTGEIAGTAEPGANVEVTVGGVPYTVVADPETGAFSVTPTAPDTFEINDDISAVASGSGGHTSAPTVAVLEGPDGIVSGYDGDDLIDTAYTGDVHGERVDGDAGDNNVIEAGAGNDTVLAGIGNDTLSGEAGDDALSGEAGNDTMSGGIGDDTLTGGAGADTQAGGDDADTFMADTQGTTITTNSYDADAGTPQGYISNEQNIDIASLYPEYDGEYAEVVSVTLWVSNAGAGEGFVRLNVGGNLSDVHAIAPGQGETEITFTFPYGSEVNIGSTVNPSTEAGVFMAPQFLTNEDGSGGVNNPLRAGLRFRSSPDEENVNVEGIGATAFQAETVFNFVNTNDFAGDVITGGEGGEDSDTLDLSEATANVTLDLTAGTADDLESGTISAGGQSGNFAEVEDHILGAGDDALVLNSDLVAALAAEGNTTDIDAGAGFDRIRFDGAGEVLNASDLAGGDHLTGFEMVDNTGSGDNTLAITAADLASLTGDDDTLYVKGDAGDVVDTGGSFAPTGETTTYEGTVYNEFVDGDTTLWVADGVVVDPAAPTINPLATGVLEPVLDPSQSVISGTGEPGATIALTDADGEPIALVDAEGNALDPVNEVTVGEDGTWSAITPEALGDDVTVTATQQLGASPEAVTETLVLDTDGDGARNTVDIDDDNDGILDVNEGIWEAGEYEALTTGASIMFDDLAGTMPGGLSDNSVPEHVTAGSAISFGSEFDGVQLVADGSEQTFQFQQGTGTAATVDEAVANGSYVDFSFTTADDASRTLAMSQFTTGISRGFNGTMTVFVNGEEVISSGLTSHAAATLDLSDSPVALLNDAENTVRVVFHGDDANGNFSVNGFGLQLSSSEYVWNDDTDGDGTINALDTDSDNGGIGDTAEAQYGQEFVGAAYDEDGNWLDSDGDGLNDAWDETPGGQDEDGDDLPSGADGSVGLTPADTDADGTPDVYQGAPDEDSMPLSIQEALTSGISGTGIPGATVQLSDADGDFGDPITVGEDGTWTVDFDPQREAEDVTATMTAEHLPDEEATATAALEADTDGDGVGNSTDIDDDNDGILDVNEQPASMFVAEYEGTFGNLTDTNARDLQNAVDGYSFSASNTGSSQYAVVNAAGADAFHPATLFDHLVDNTTGSADGAFLVVNGGTAQGSFFTEAITLTANTDYDFGFFSANGVPSSQASSYPFEIGMRVLDVSGNIVANITDGPQSSIQWEQHESSFNTGSETMFAIEVYNISTNASGNDFAIDDIYVRPSGGIASNDIDNDGAINALDTDSDNGGIGDTAEAQYNQEYVGPAYDEDGNWLDSDGDGLNDAWDETPGGQDEDGDDLPSGADGSIGLIPADTDADGTPDVYQGAPGEDSMPLSIQEALTSGISGTGIPGATVQLSDADGDFGDPITVGEDGTWSADFDPQREAEDVTATMTADHLPDEEATATAALEADTDGDGVGNSTDIDDDNDGILDVDEDAVLSTLSATPQAAGENAQGNFNGWVPDGDYTITSNTTDGNVMSIVAESPAYVSSGTAGSGVSGHGVINRVLIKPELGGNESISEFSLSVEMGRADDGYLLEINGTTVLEFNATHWINDPDFKKGQFDLNNNNVWNIWTGEGDPELIYDATTGEAQVLATTKSGERLNVLDYLDTVEFTYNPMPLTAEDILAGVTVGTSASDLNGANPLYDPQIVKASITLEGVGDTDGDGTINSLDTDSDNGGIVDLVENGGEDADGDGMIDDFVDENGNGLADSVEDEMGESVGMTQVDANDNGTSDVYEASGGSDAYPFTFDPMVSAAPGAEDGTIVTEVSVSADGSVTETLGNAGGAVTQVTGTGYPGSTIYLLDTQGQDVSAYQLVDEAGQPIDSVTVGADGTWSAIPATPLADDTVLTVQQTPPEDSGLEPATLTDTIIRDFDNDGVRDTVDIDDDDDGILDYNEIETGGPVVVSGTASGKTLTIGDGDITNTITYTGHGGNISGSGSIGFTERGWGTSLNTDRTFGFELPVSEVAIYFGNLVGGARMGNFSVTYSDGSVQTNLTLAKTGDLYLAGDAQSIVGRTDSNQGNGLVTFTNLDPDLRIASLTFQQTGTTSTSGSSLGATYQIRVPAVDATRDADEDNSPNHLDTDSDNGGVSDNFETQMDYGFTAPSGVDADDDGLDDAYTLDGEAGRYGLDFSDVNGNDTPDVYESDSGGNAVQETFAYTGADQTFTIPEGVTSIDVSAWGAGGGDDGYANATATGGAGGFTGATLAVNPGDEITIVVGQGGELDDTDGQYGGGGAGGDSGPGGGAALIGSSGGGRSAILINGVEVLTAGGGGGGAGGLPGHLGSSYAGAGGETGQDAEGQGSREGGGATATAGGTGGGTGSLSGEDGSQFQGGAGGDTNSNSGGAGGGGGGGYFGGGGGNGDGHGGNQDASGGGGSSYADDSVASNVIFVDGDRTTAANTDDPNYVAGIGEGGDNNDAGGNGLIVISYNEPPVDTLPLEITNATTSVIEGTGVPGSEVTLDINGTDYGPVTVGENGTWEYSVEPATPQITEVKFAGTGENNAEFIEVYVPNDTDLTSYALSFYQLDGTLMDTTFSSFFENQAEFTLQDVMDQVVAETGGATGSVPTSVAGGVPLSIDLAADGAYVFTIPAGGGFLSDSESASAVALSVLDAPGDLSSGTVVQAYDYDFDSVAPTITATASEGIAAGTDFTVITQPADAAQSIQLTQLGTSVPGVPTPGEVDVEAFAGTVTATATLGELTSQEAGPVDILLDSDGDGVANVTDIDDDNDGILDVVEIEMSAEDAIAAEQGTVLFAESFEITPSVPAGSPDSNELGAVTLAEVNSSTLPGWTVSGSGQTFLARDDGNTENGIAATDGTQSIWLNENDATITSDQTFNVQEGYRYVLTVDVWADNVNAATAVEVTFAGETQTLSISTAQGNDGVAQQVYFDFVAPADLTDQAITMREAGSTTASPVVDNVRLVEFAPAPESNDVDGDGIDNHLDADSDDGGIDDNVEAQYGSDFIEASGMDANRDGLDDAYDFTATGGGLGLDPNQTGVNHSVITSEGGVDDHDGDGIASTHDIDDDGDGILDVNEVGGLGAAPVDFSDLAYSGAEIGRTFSQDTEGNAVVGVTLTSSTGGGFQGISDGGFQGYFGNGNGTRTVTSQLDFDQSTDFRIAADTNSDGDVTDGTASNSNPVRDLVRFTVINPSDDFDWNFTDANFINPATTTVASSFTISDDGLTLTLDLGNSGGDSNYMGYDFTVLGEADGVIHSFTERGSGANSNGFSLWTPTLDSDGDGILNALETDSNDDGISDRQDVELDQTAIDALEAGGANTDGFLVIADSDGLTLDLDALSGVSGLEYVNMDGTTGQSITLSDLGILSSTEANKLVIFGDSSDTVDATGFTATGSIVNTGNKTLDIYDLNGSTLLLDDEVSVII